MCKAFRQIPQIEVDVDNLTIFMPYKSHSFPLEEIKEKLFTSDMMQQNNFMLCNLHLYCFSGFYLSIFMATCPSRSTENSLSRVYVRFLVRVPVVTEDATMSFAYVSETITKGKNPLYGPPFPAVNKYSRPAAGPRRAQLVKRIVLRDVSRYWLSRSRGISSVERRSFFGAIVRLLEVEVFQRILLIRV